METILPLTDEHKAFQEEFHEFVMTEMVPHYAEWQENREVSKDLYKKAGEKGYLCMWADPKYGGQGKDKLYSIIEVMETSRQGLSGAALWLDSDVVAPYIEEYGSEDIKQEVLPQLIAGDKLICVCMTEPEHGSDLACIESSAVRDGDNWVINAHKCFITNGYISDYAVVACRTDPEAKPGKGISIFLVDLHDEHVRREKMKKHGFHAQDTAEIWIEDLVLPASRMLGEENAGYGYLMHNLQFERLVAAQLAQGQGERALQITAAYTKEREMFGTTLNRLQNTQFTLADMAIDVAAGRALVDAATIAYMRGEDIASDVSAAKAFATEKAYSVADRGLQLVGGKGYCYEDSEIGRLWADLRVQRMSAGTTEIMKLLIGRAC